MKNAFIAATVAAVATLGMGCQKKAETPADPPAGTMVEVVSGMENQIFTAPSPTEIRLSDGTTAEPVAEADGVVRSVIIARDNSNGIKLECACGIGCAPGGAAGCVAGISPDGHSASCGGICQAPNMSCGDCRLWYAQPNAGSTHAIWVKRKDLTATQQ